MQITIQSLKKHITSHGLIIDTRDYKECLETGVIPTAEIIPLSQIEEAFTLSESAFEDKYDFAKPTKEELLIFYCESGSRSRIAAVVLAKMGYNTANYIGSITEWIHTGEEVEFREDLVDESDE